MLWLIPIIFLLLLTPWSKALDLFVAKTAFEHPWNDTVGVGFYSNSFFDFIYIWGVVPAQLVCTLSILFLIVSIWIVSLQRFRSIFLLLGFTFFIGSGLITSVVLKEHWGRPRPRQIVEFGGTEPFRPYHEPLFSHTSVPVKSFPSGHSTCGFYFLALYFIGRRCNSKLLKKAGITLGILLGTLLSVARIMQGGHFMTDVLAAALIMWLTAYFVDYVVFEAPFLSHFRKKIFNDDICYKHLAYKTGK